MVIGKVYAITDRALLPGEQLYSAAEQALAAGIRTLQLRDKVATGKQLTAMAARLLKLCHCHDAQLIINDDVDLAATIGAHGVHLGRGDGSIKAARRRLGSNFIIGATCHNQLAWAKEAQQDGADYVAFGRFFASSTKPDASTAPVELLQQAKGAITIPLVAIGGINSVNAPELFHAGADSVAVCASVFAADDVRAAAQQMLAVACQTT